MKASRRSSGWLAPSPPGVAIEIAARRVTVAEVAAGSGGPVVRTYATESLPEGLVTPALTAPNVSVTAEVAAVLRRALDRAGLGTPRRAALVIPDSVARVSLLHFEQVPGRASDRDQLVRWQLRKATPFPLEEAQLSYFVAHTEPGSSTLAAVVARRDVIAQYEAVPGALGIHAGLVDLASFNVINALIRAGAAPAGDALLVCLAAEATSLAILRGPDLMFYRHRTAVDEEPIGALVHQTAMYHEDRLGGTRFARVWLCGAALAGHEAEQVRREITERLGVPADAVDIRSAAGLQARIAPAPDVLDALAAPVGVLLRERQAA
jgi:Tfp pilus assembly PilM family ATPase